VSTATKFVESWQTAHPNAELLDVKFYFARFPVTSDALWAQAVESINTAGPERNFENWPKPERTIPLTKIVGLGSK
jgi:FMN-dependent NADH-azoreductase